MCGFVLSINFSEEGLVGISDNKKAISRISHRGPDYAHTISVGDGKLILSHCRLSIIDVTSQANQPMQSECERYFLLFNGEIYNYKWLKKYLISRFKGVLWKTNNSDTEVLLQSLILLGLERTLELIDGMFSFVFLDLKENSTVMCRDRFGEKPLYKYVDNDVLIVSSDVSAIKSIVGGELEVDKLVIAEYLKYGAILAPATVYKRVEKVPAATYSKFNYNSFSGHDDYVEYWDIFSSTSKESPKLKDVCESIEEKMVSDVGVGFYLSGGVDSSIIAKKISTFDPAKKDKITAYSIGFDFENGGETAEAEALCEELGLSFKAKVLSDEHVYKYLEAFLEKIEEPNADPTVVPGLAISEMSSRQDKVVLTGEGADEVFWGYPHWSKYIYVDLLFDFLPSLFAKMGRKLIELSVGRGGHLFEMLDRKVKGQSSFFGGCEIFTIGEIQELLKYDFNSPSTGIKRHWDNFIEIPNSKLIDWYTYIETKNRMPELILSRVDMVSMRFSQEARAPFLSRKLFENSRNIPLTHRLKRKTNKPYLRNMVKDFLPDSVLSRKKKGFSTPYQFVFEGSKGNDYIRYIEDNAEGFGLEKMVISRLVVEKKYYKLWAILILLRWYEKQ